MDGYAELAPHTRLKAEAIIALARDNPDIGFFLMGGYNFGIRYDDTEIMKTPDFSFATMAKARDKFSESQAVMMFCEGRGVSRERMLVEEVSATTEEQAVIAKMMIRRTTFSEVEKVWVMSVATHLRRTFSAFGEGFTPRYVEDVLREAGEGYQVLKYYQDLAERSPAGLPCPIKDIESFLTGSDSIASFL